VIHAEGFMMMLERETIHRSEDLTPLHLIEAGDRTALICITDQALSEAVAQVVQKLKYHVVVAQHSASALSRIDHDQYQLIVLEEGYGGTDLSTNPVLLCLQRLPMPVRRKSFLCLLSEQTPTLDHMAAFRVGVNLILNGADVEKMPLLLDRLIKDHEAFYAAFIDELTKRGTSSV
jgi:hypothetical protein